MLLPVLTDSIEIYGVATCMYVCSHALHACFTYNLYYNILILSSTRYIATTVIATIQLKTKKF